MPDFHPGSQESEPLNKSWNTGVSEIRKMGSTERT